MYELFHRFQEYKQSLEKLRKAYFRETNNADEIQRGNIDLITDLMFGDILKTVALQSKVNNRLANRKDHRNTFLFRSDNISFNVNNK